MIKFGITKDRFWNLSANKLLPINSTIILYHPTLMVAALPHSGSNCEWTMTYYLRERINDNRFLTYR